MSRPGTDRPTRVSGFNEDSAVDTAESSPLRQSPSRANSQQTAQPLGQATPTQRRKLSERLSFTGVLRHRPSFVERWRTAGGDEEAGLGGEMPSPKVERPPIPSALQPTSEVYSTPLPMISMTVLSIVSEVLATLGLLIHILRRQCLESSFLRMSLRRFCYSWLRVSQLVRINSELTVVYRLSPVL